MQLTQERFAYLDSVVTLRTCTAQELIELFHHYQSSSIAMGNVIVPDYIKDTELPQLWAALDWWPKHGLPSTHDFSTLERVSLFSVYNPHVSAPIRAMEILQRKGAEVAEFLLVKGSSVVNPNETPGERKARKNREAQSRHRDKQKANADPAIEAARIAYVTAYEAYQKVCAERKRADEYFKNQIAEATANYKKLQEEYDKVRK